MEASVETWSDRITALEAYQAMIEFIWTYFKVGGETENEVAFFAHHLASGLPVALDNGTVFPGDPALQNEWFEAIAKVTS